MHLWWPHVGIHTIQGKWSTQETQLLLKLLELRAVRNASIHFLPLIRNRAIKIMTDNVASMFYINWQVVCVWGEIPFFLFQRNKAMELMRSQLHPNLGSLLPGYTKHYGWWPQQAVLPELQMGAPQTLKHIFLTFGVPEVNLFVIVTNRNCKQFCLGAEL